MDSTEITVILYSFSIDNPLCFKTYAYPVPSEVSSEVSRIQAM